MPHCLLSSPRVGFDNSAHGVSETSSRVALEYHGYFAVTRVICFSGSLSKTAADFGSSKHSSEPPLVMEIEYPFPLRGSRVDIQSYTQKPKIRIKTRWLRLPERR